MRRALPTVLAAGLAAAPAAGAAADGPLVVQRWVVPAPVQAAMPGPLNGLVTVTGPTGGAGPVRTMAFRVDGTRLWTRGRVAACGNCDEGPQPIRLQVDGTYGPIGPAGDDIWAYDRAGRTAPACSGAVAPNGTCVSGGITVRDRGEGGPPPRFVETPYLAAARGAGTAVWRTELTDLRWLPAFDVPPAVARDAAGNAYAAFPGAERLDDDGRPEGGITVAVRAATGQPRARVDGPEMVLAGLPAGVLAVDRGLVALAPDGRQRWRRDVPDWRGIAPGTVRADNRRGTVYVGIPGKRPRAVALNAATGAARWGTLSRDRARFMAASSRGRAYVAADAGPRRGLVAFTAAGRPLWRLPLAARIVAATPIGHGRVAVIARPPRAERAVAMVVRPPR